MQQISDYSRGMTAAVKAELARRDLTGADLPALIQTSRTTAYSRLNYERPFEMGELERFCDAIGISMQVLIASANLAPVVRAKAVAA
ncbi:hypothetical protein [Microbacterium sp. MMO-10]|uniref:hypothetical protein n=1 Tax=Microbacterium sp. MMO-10 TaxID=3081272 RepID=UPI00301AB8C7